MFSHYPRFGLFRGCFKNLEEWWFGVRGEEASEEAERAALVGHIWRQLAFTAVQQQSKLLLDRLQLMGDGATEVEVERRRGGRHEKGKHKQCAFARDVL